MNPVTVSGSGLFRLLSKRITLHKMRASDQNTTKLWIFLVLMLYNVCNIKIQRGDHL